MAGPWQWLFFLVMVMSLLGLDLEVLNRRPHVVSFREASIRSAFWIALALAFGAGIYWRYGAEPSLQFFTSYLLEGSLSADNVFLFALIFTGMGVAAEYQHRALFWGVLGGLVLRGAFILAGVQLVRHFHWILYFFAVLLIVMGVRLFGQHGKKRDPAYTSLLTFVRRILPVADGYEGGGFIARCNGRLCVTPLLLVMVVIELVDVTFALDSIPAVFAVTQDAFVIFASNILAVLALRSLYFLLAGAMARFRYLHVALATVLIFIGARMLCAHWIQVPTAFAVLGIVAILAVAIVASVVSGKPSVDVPVDLEIRGKR
jgi:tellurite resistance protein TerC